jgi:hypothetical protein
LTSRFPTVGDHIDWQVALAHYDAERLDDAYEKALDLGMGGHTQYLTWYRTIEAEALTAQRSSVQSIWTNLDLEWIEEEMEGRAPSLAETAISAFDDIGHRFGYGHESKVKLTVLAAETDAPWLFGRFGYCTAKAGFYKICIPANLIHQADELRRTLQHEYAHVVAGTLSNRKCPRWLEEALAMQAEGGVSRNHARLFASGEEEWLRPIDLEADLRDLDNSRDKWLAYLQSGLVGGYMATLKGEASFGRLLRSFGASGYWQEFWARLRGLAAEDLPVRREFGISLEVLFERAFQWVRAGR